MKSCARKSSFSSLVAGCVCVGSNATTPLYVHFRVATTETYQSNSNDHEWQAHLPAWYKRFLGLSTTSCFAREASSPKHVTRFIASAGLRTPKASSAPLVTIRFFPRVTEIKFITFDMKFLLAIVSRHDEEKEQVSMSACIALLCADYLSSCLCSKAQNECLDSWPHQQSHALDERVASRPAED